MDQKINTSEVIHRNFNQIGSTTSFGTLITAEGTHSRLLSTTMQNTKKIDFQVDETDENCLAFASPLIDKPPRYHRKK